MTWHVVRLSLSLAETLGRIRELPGLEVCPGDEEVWVRAANLSEDLAPLFDSLPGTQYHAAEDGQLLKRGQRVPHGYLPREDWIPLDQWLAIELKTPALGGAAPDPMVPRMVACTETQEANLLLANEADWLAYVVTAPQVRLDRLVFALSDDRYAMIWGTPLPPIKGTRFVERSSVAIQAGWNCEPPLDAEVLAQAIGLSGASLALIYADGQVEQVPQDQFVQASRASVRRSTGEAVDE